MSSGHWVDVEERSPEKSGDYAVLRKIGTRRKTQVNIEKLTFDAAAGRWLDRWRREVGTVREWWEEEPD